MTTSSTFFSSFCLLSVFLSSLLAAPAQGVPQSRNIYQIKVYLLKDRQQEERLDKYLQSALLPALHREGIPKVGVFKPLANDTSAFRSVYVLIPFSSLAQWQKLPDLLLQDSQYALDSKDYGEAPYTDPPYLRIESILLEAFAGMPGLGISELKGPLSERIYELRSYEGATEKIHANKVKMFNDGNEIALFKSLGFNAVFYADVISGAHMPNLMYMTSFENMAAHDAHWKDFSANPTWKELSAMPEYQHNVSHIDITLMHPAPYSDL
jgi:hypothetical protein